MRPCRCRELLVIVAVALLLACGETAARATDLVAQQNARIPSLSCEREPTSRDDALAYGLVEKRVRDGQLFAAYAEVLSLPADHAKNALLRADILRRLGRSEARAWYVALLKTCEVAAARHGLGQLAAFLSDWQGAVTEFQQAVLLMPTSPRFRNDLGYALIQVGDNDAAAFELQTAAELGPENRLTSMNQLLLHMMRGDMAAAEQLIVRVQPTRSEFDDLLGDCARLLTRRAGVQTTCPMKF